MAGAGCVCVGGRSLDSSVRSAHFDGFATPGLLCVGLLWCSHASPAGSALAQAPLVPCALSIRSLLFLVAQHRSASCLACFLWSCVCFCFVLFFLCVLRRLGLRPKAVLPGTPEAKNAKVCSNPGFRSRGLTDGVWLGSGRVVGFRCKLLEGARSSLGRSVRCSVGVSRGLALRVSLLSGRGTDRAGRSLSLCCFFGLLRLFCLFYLRGFMS